MTISIVAALYNGEKYIVEQLDSIRNQSKQPDQVILVDDRSSDSTYDIVQDYIYKYNLSQLWMIYRNSVNRGYANNFRIAAKYATGDILFFMDQDDLWETDKIKTMIKYLDLHKECMLLCTDYYPFSDTGSERIPKQVLKRMPNDGSIELINLTKKHIYIKAIGCCMCVRRDFYLSIDKYWYDNWAHDDRLWKLSQCVPNACHLYHTPLVRHRIHANNTATYGNYHDINKRIIHFQNMKKAAEQMLLFTEEQEINSKYQHILKKHIFMLEKRIEMMNNRKVVNALLLFFFISYYESKKSWLLELYLSIKKKN